MKYYLIYQIRNKLNGMIYIGKHTTKRKNDSYMGSGLRIQYAIKKYGIENFEKTILFECASAEEMNAKEAEIVNEDFIARDDVYNIKLGGDGGWDHFNWKNVPVEKQELRRQKISQKLTNTKFSDERKLKHSIGHINAYKKDPTKCGMFGKVHSVESKEKMSKAHSGKKNNQYGKMWICNDETHESKPILKTDTIPNGWRKGRFCK